MESRLLKHGLAGVLGKASALLFWSGWRPWRLIELIVVGSGHPQVGKKSEAIRQITALLSGPDLAGDRPDLPNLPGHKWERHRSSRKAGSL